MPRARLELQSDEGLITLSEAHPEVAFELLGAWPHDDRLRAPFSKRKTSTPLPGGDSRGQLASVGRSRPV